ncbi:lipoprotein [Spiroplasma endosymbiont of Virgichneumon dumeticola]|uniref:lipoprotein n=1 Tax=Spiroplasma endosymbiont of Virgichneumon dumeticola TaxID=3139323 RepID=UPI0035C91CC9
MKKILSILVTTFIATTASTNVVACGTKSNASPVPTPDSKNFTEVVTTGIAGHLSGLINVNGTIYAVAVSGSGSTISTKLYKS